MSRQPISGRDALSDVARQQLRSYGVILGAFVLLLAVALAASWGAIRVVDATRAYVTGEGRYSKAEKIAVLSLHRYAYLGHPRDYADFLAAITVPRGDHMARAALQNPEPDLVAIRKGFLLGENHPDDIAGMIGLFRWFSWWQPFAEAVGDWRAGDGLVVQLIGEGAHLHTMIVTHALDAQSRVQLLDRVDQIDGRLTSLENKFSSHLGDAARLATLLVVVGLSVMTILLWTMGTTFAARLVKRQLALGTQLGSSERRFRDYAEVASDWYWEMDANHRVTYISERFSSMMGMPTEEVLGTDAAEFISDCAVSPQQRDVYLSALAGQRAFRSVQTQYTVPDGTMRYWSISAKPLFSASGTLLGYRGIGSDITAAIHDAQVLEAAKVRAEAANRAKSEFLANMSHELRTPLNAILGFSDVIRGQMMGREAIDRYSAYAADIRTSGEHLLSIINDILDLSKIEAGHSQLSEREMGLDEMSDTLQTLLADRFGGGGLSFALELPDPPPLIFVDERKFAQIFINLLSNALKFTPRGGSVTLGARREVNGTLSVYVRDTGIGIAAKYFEAVLAPFGQVESAFSRHHHGTGLGLPLAKSLAELHGATLRLESTPGAGTCVTITLPRTRILAHPHDGARSRG
jgi:PAS domain S-box-containing protein